MGKKNTPGGRLRREEKFDGREKEEAWTRQWEIQGNTTSKPQSEHGPHESNSDWQCCASNNNINGGRRRAAVVAAAVGPATRGWGIAGVQHQPAVLSARQLWGTALELGGNVRCVAQVMDWK